MPKNSTINRKTKEEVQESVDNLRKAITTEKQPAIVRQHWKQITWLLRTYGFLGVR